MGAWGLAFFCSGCRAYGMEYEIEKLKGAGSKLGVIGCKIGGSAWRKI